jgi:hypothetical protein
VSPGAKAGIGVGVSLFALALISFGAYVIMRRRQSRVARLEADDYVHPAPHHSAATDVYYGYKAELPVTSDADHRTLAYSPAELETALGSKPSPEAELADTSETAHVAGTQVYPARADAHTTPSRGPNPEADFVNHAQSQNQISSVPTPSYPQAKFFYEGVSQTGPSSHSQRPMEETETESVEEMQIRLQKLKQEEDNLTRLHQISRERAELERKLATRLSGSTD